MPAAHYPAVIDRSASGFGVSFPDFPGCVAAGLTASEAALNAEAALALHVEALVKDKDDLPDPSPLEAIEPVEGADDVARILVRVDVPVKVERVLISIDANLLRAIDAVASNRSAWFADAARSCLAEAARSHRMSFSKEVLRVHGGSTAMIRSDTIVSHTLRGTTAAGEIVVSGPRPDPIKRKKRALQID